MRFEIDQSTPARNRRVVGRRLFETDAQEVAQRERVSVKKAWETALLRAHGYEPEWKGSTLAPASRAQLRTINLHFHDLRHEAGCRWLEAGWPIHHVKEMLGHMNLSQTSTYLHAAEMGLQESMRRFDTARVEAASGDFRGKTVANMEQKEQQPLCHEEVNDDGKRLLH